MYREERFSEKTLEKVYSLCHEIVMRQELKLLMAIFEELEEALEYFDENKMIVTHSNGDMLVLSLTDLGEEYFSQNPVARFAKSSYIEKSLKSLEDYDDKYT